eukprot:jgi/Mesvir1/3909/Mv19852-RA.1
MTREFREAVVLTLRPRRRVKKSVSWTQDTVDNEGLGKKSSKKCCIYHKPRAFGESSSDSEGEQKGNRHAHRHCPGCGDSPPSPAHVAGPSGINGEASGAPGGSMAH